MTNKQKPNANIYIVDHDPVYTSSLKNSIEKPEKYSIETFHTGEKFIAHLASLKFKRKDILIVFLGYHFFSDTDNTLMNGIEILEATKIINPSIEVVMLYTHDEASYGAYAKKSGAYAFVPKTDTIFLRINNIIMRIISQNTLLHKRLAFQLSVRLFIASLVLASTATALYYFFIVLR